MVIETAPEAPPLKHLAVCVTFLYRPERLSYLAAVVSNYADIAIRAEIYIVTDVVETESLAEALPRSSGRMSVEFVAFPDIDHPYLLTWMHREIFQEVLAAGVATHFLYSEDDLLFGRSNVMYWLRYRDSLESHGLIPSFFRVEMHRRIGWVSTDCQSPVQIEGRPNILLDNGALFVCMPSPYQGMYFLDRELMEEFAASPAMSSDFGGWDIRERAAQGLTFVNIPVGYASRNVVLVDTHAKTVSREAWVHHLPNNYANNANTPFGKLPMQAPGVFEDPRGRNSPLPEQGKVSASRRRRRRITRRFG